MNKLEYIFDELGKEMDLLLNVNLHGKQRDNLEHVQGMKYVLDKFRAALAGGAWVDTYSEPEKTAGPFCCERCDMHIEDEFDGVPVRWCATTNEMLEKAMLYTRPDWCPAFVVEVEP